MAKKEQGLLAIFQDPQDLLLAARQVRATRVTQMEAFTPFPVHGLEAAMGLKRSWIPWATLVLGITGWCLGFIFQAWTSAVDWPLNIGGKPFISWPAFIPITFECMVLIAGVSTVLILVVACRLPNFTKPPLDARLTADRFGLLVANSDTYFDASAVKKICEECRAAEVRLV